MKEPVSIPWDLLNKGVLRWVEDPSEETIYQYNTISGLVVRPISEDQYQKTFLGPLYNSVTIFLMK